MRMWCLYIHTLKSVWINKFCIMILLSPSLGPRGMLKTQADSRWVHSGSFRIFSVYWAVHDLRLDIGCGQSWAIHHHEFFIAFPEWIASAMNHYPSPKSCEALPFPRFPPAQATWKSWKAQSLVDWLMGEVCGSCGCNWGNAVCVCDVDPPRMLVESEVWYWDSLATKCEVNVGRLWDGEVPQSIGIICIIYKYIYICYGISLFWYYFMLLFAYWCVFLAIGWNMATGCMVHLLCEPPGGGQQDAVNSSGPTCTAQPCTAGVRTSQLTSKS